ncbi:MAG: methylated-DNA--[protein]-cysteine S-methyltransferase [Blastocatellia bacterium]
MNHLTYYAILDSPVGPLLLTSNGESLTGLFTEQHKGGPAPRPDWHRDEGSFAAPRRQLAAYFAGELTEFDLPLAPHGTPFQLRVWEELRRIPYGVTMSYGELARTIGNPNASRAVGAANGKNPISIVIPCHRVIGSNSDLTGYAGGIEAKKLLLDLEFAALNRRAGG